MNGPAGDSVVSLLFDPVGGWSFVAVVAAALAAVLLLVGPDRSRISSRQRMTLVLLRVAAFLAVIGCMLRPTLVGSEKSRQEELLVVLADASESMTVADEPGGQTRWERLRESLTAAEGEAGEMLADGHHAIRVWRFDRGVDAVEVSAGSPFPLGAWEKRAGSGETALGSALDDAVRATAGTTLAGVLLLSDGAQHAYAPRDMPPQLVARRLGDSGVPLWTVLYGQQRSGLQGRDAAVEFLGVREEVFVKTSVEVTGRVRLSGLADREVPVLLLAEDEEGTMREVARMMVRGTAEATEETVRLRWTPQAVGERKLVMRIEPLDNETVVTNNELSTFVNVIDGGLRVVYLEGALRVEQRFLRRVLLASPDMQVDFEWIDASQRGRWPADLGGLVSGDVDVFLIGDLDATAISKDDAEQIRERVEAGAGIGLLGGIHAFEAGGWSETPLSKLLPFMPDRLARQAFDEPVRRDLHLSGPLRMLPARRAGRMAIMQLADPSAGPEANRAAWQALPPLDGASRLGRLAPQATVLAETEKREPLLVARNYGAGRVAAFAGDSSWRWVMQGAGDEHRRFWRQFVFWLAGRDELTRESLWVRPLRRRVAPGVSLEFSTGMTRGDGEPIDDVTITAESVDPDGRRRPLRLFPEGDALAGDVSGFSLPGDWKIAVTAARDGEVVATREARFTVYRQDLELANPVANALLMRQLAEETGQRPRSPEEIGEILAEIKARPAVYDIRQQWSWDFSDPTAAWPMLLLTVGLMATEWFFRKRWGLA